MLKRPDIIKHASFPPHVSMEDYQEVLNGIWQTVNWRKAARQKAIEKRDVVAFRFPETDNGKR